MGIVHSIRQNTETRVVGSVDAATGGDNPPSLGDKCEYTLLSPGRLLDVNPEAMRLNPFSVLTV